MTWCTKVHHFAWILQQQKLCWQPSVCTDQLISRSPTCQTTGEDEILGAEAYVGGEVSVTYAKK